MCRRVGHFGEWMKDLGRDRGGSRWGVGGRGRAWQMNEDVGRWVEELWMDRVVWKINGEW